MLAIIGDWKTWMALLLLSGMTCRGAAQDKPPAVDGPTSQAAQPLVTQSGDQADAENAVDKKDVAKRILGDYEIVEGRVGKSQILPERLADITVKITEKTITTYDGDRKQRFSASYKLDLTQMPWRIHMTPVEVAVPTEQPKTEVPAATKSQAKTIGLIELSKDATEAKLIYALPGGTDPKSFEPEAQQQRFLLKRLKSNADAAKEANRSQDAKREKSN